MCTQRIFIAEWHTLNYHVYDEGKYLLAIHHIDLTLTYAQHQAHHLGLQR